MDPNEALSIMRARVLEIHAAWDVESQSSTDLADAVEALDEWLVSGGFLPTEWDVRG